MATIEEMFQSPRSGKFVSDPSLMIRNGNGIKIMCFNPLYRGNLYQIEDWDWAIQSVLGQVSIP